MLRDRAYCLCVHTLEGEEGGGPSADALKSAKAAALRKARRDEAARLKRENDMQTKAGWTLSCGAAATHPRLVFLSAMKLSASLSISGTRAALRHRRHRHRHRARRARIRNRRARAVTDDDDDDDEDPETSFLDTTERDAWGRNALHRACIEGSMTLANALLKLGAGLDFADKRGARPLMLAVGYAELSDAEMGEQRGEILSVTGVGSQPTETKRSAADRASERLNAWKQPATANSIFVKLPAGAGIDPAAAAARGAHGARRAPDRLCDGGRRRLRARVGRSARRQRRALRGARRQRQAAARGPRGRGLAKMPRESMIDARDRDGWTAVHYACYYGRVAALQVLIDAGADLNIVAEPRGGLWTPLHAACGWWRDGQMRAATQLEIVARLVMTQKIDDFDAKEVLFGRTPAQLAWDRGASHFDVAYFMRAHADAARERKRKEEEARRIQEEADRKKARLFLMAMEGSGATRIQGMWRRRQARRAIEARKQSLLQPPLRWVKHVAGTTACATTWAASKRLHACHDNIAPLPRSHATLTAVGGSLWLFGGMALRPTEGNRGPPPPSLSNELWEYRQFEHDEYEEIAAPPKPTKPKIKKKKKEVQMTEAMIRSQELLGESSHGLTEEEEEEKREAEEAAARERERKRVGVWTLHNARGGRDPQGALATHGRRGRRCGASSSAAAWWTRTCGCGSMTCTCLTLRTRSAPAESR